MRKTMKRGFACIVTLCLIVVSLNYMSELLRRKDSDEKYQPFFDQEEDFDVLFFGSSHTMDAVFPLELWNDYGIVSYNFGGIGNRIPTSYWLMRNALDYTEPELIVVDCFLLRRTAKVSDNFGEVHQSMDAFPLSATKIAAARDLTEETEQDEYENVNRSSMELIWDFSVYHNRWNEISEGNFSVTPTIEMGAQSQIAVGVPNEVPDVSRQYMLEEDTVGVEYLEKIIEECQSRGIEVLLVYFPFPASEEEQMEANRTYEIAEEYGVNYINFLDLDVVDYHTDCCDADSHLNVSGARKVTDYLGQYIVDHYDIEDQRGNAAYDSWFAYYEQYEEWKLTNLKDQQTLDTYLMLLADQNYNMMIEFNNLECFQDERYAHLFENLGLDMGKITENTDFVVIQGAGEQVAYLSDFKQSGSVCETAVGTFSLYVDETGSYGAAGTYGVYLNGEECYTVQPEDNEDIDVRMIVWEKDTMQVLDAVGLSIATEADAEIIRE